MIRKNVLCLFLIVATAVGIYAKETDPTRWESDIQAFEKQDREHPPKQEGILFLGSSSIRLWDVKKWFPDYDAINRGFGGSQIEDSLYYVDRLVYPYQPRIIVFYAGDNDIAAGKSARRVFDDYQKFVGKVREKLPKTKIVFVAIKPCRSRWQHIHTVREANRLIQEWSKKDERLAFLDIDAPMIGDDGKPMTKLFRDDQLHLNETGYALWSKMLMPFLK